MLKGVLFDLDGVIVDTLHYHYLAWKHMFEERGGTVSEQTVLLHEGRSSREILPILMQEAGLSVPESEWTRFIEEKRAYYRTIVQVSSYPESFEVVRKLKERGFKTALRHGLCLGKHAAFTQSGPAGIFRLHHHRRRAASRQTVSRLVSHRSPPAWAQPEGMCGSRKCASRD